MVRRALPVPVTVRRAILQRLPAQELGVYKWYPAPLDFGGGRSGAIHGHQKQILGNSSEFGDRRSLERGR